MVDASLELYPIPYSMLKLLCLSEPKKKAGRLGSYAKPEKRNLLSIFELRGYDRLLIRLFLKSISGIGITYRDITVSNLLVLYRREKMCVRVFYLSVGYGLLKNPIGYCT
uniref:hypothetical protein n=1 Tax=Bidens parviflora TaxID=1527830 RepID=UPI001FF59612|nr:hypothetical protein MFQ53_mgp68 [Bidens parviflora]UIR98913.1 hypothetical protein [Bidens parviflora]